GRLGTKEPEKWLDVLDETLAEESEEVVINELEHAQKLLRRKLK
ncbi:MAG TPA: tRNA epoxyqueuosine(34) reductase QueG, partial [Enterococcus sp.]|nr:tRNA epoxyqueuosine(34) reductase QueG [Enterococcus sp.]